MTDEFLLGVAGVSATVIGLFVVGVFFYVEAGMRRPMGTGRASLQPYMRAGTRIVLLLFAMVLLLSLGLVAFDLSWSRAVFVIMSGILVVANIDTAIRFRTVRVTGTRTLLLNEVAGSVGVLAIVILPWVLGGLRPSREGLTLAALIAFATAFMSVGALAVSAFDVARLDSADRPGAAPELTSAPAAKVHRLHLVSVAGTTGLDPASAADASLAEQLTLIWSNLRAILAATGMTLDDVVRVTSYLRDAADVDESARAQAGALAGRTVPTIAVVADSLAEGWLVEIEVVAVV